MTALTIHLEQELNGLIDSLDEHVSHEDIAQALSELRDRVRAMPPELPDTEPDVRNPLDRLTDDMEHLHRMFSGELGNIVTPEWRTHRAREDQIIAAWSQPDPEIPGFNRPTGFTADPWTIAVFRHLATVYPLDRSNDLRKADPTTTTTEHADDQ
jgi:hypothetical protein